MGKKAQHQSPSPNPTRKSRRLGGETVEFTKDKLDEVLRVRRSPSRSCTPTPITQSQQTVGSVEITATDFQNEKISSEPPKSNTESSNPTIENMDLLHGVVETDEIPSKTNDRRTSNRLTINFDADSSILSMQSTPKMDVSAKNGSLLVSTKDHSDSIDQENVKNKKQNNKDLTKRGHKHMSAGTPSNLIIPSMHSTPKGEISAKNHDFLVSLEDHPDYTNREMTKNLQSNNKKLTKEERQHLISGIPSISSIPSYSPLKEKVTTESISPKFSKNGQPESSCEAVENENQKNLQKNLFKDDRKRLSKGDVSCSTSILSEQKDSNELSSENANAKKDSKSSDVHQNDEVIFSVSAENISPKFSNNDKQESSCGSVEDEHKLQEKLSKKERKRLSKGDVSCSSSILSEQNDNNKLSSENANEKGINEKNDISNFNNDDHPKDEVASSAGDLTNPKRADKKKRKRKRSMAKNKSENKHHRSQLNPEEQAELDKLNQTLSEAENFNLTIEFGQPSPTKVSKKANGSFSPKKSDIFLGDDSSSINDRLLSGEEKETDQEEDEIDELMDDDHIDLSNGDEMEDIDIEDGDSSDRLEEDIEDAGTIQSRKNKLPKSSVDDDFFSLAEMEAFCDQQEKIERNLGQFQGVKQVSELIKELEEENLRPRDWDLAGEVTGRERDKDELLEKFIEADYRSKTAPVITTEVTQKIEEMIKKRVKDNLFDDVVRKKRVDESLVPARSNNVEIPARKSLAELYEGKMASKLFDTNDGNQKNENDSKLGPEVESIRKDMDSLFKKLDALSHNQFRPPEVKPEVRIFKNMPCLRAEEVGPMASVEPSSSLLAPEEVFDHAKVAPQNLDELTSTDRKRIRRFKKKKQKILSSKGIILGQTEDGISEGTVKKKKKLIKKGKEKTNESSSVVDDSSQIFKFTGSSLTANHSRSENTEEERMKKRPKTLKKRKKKNLLRIPLA